MSPPTDFEAMGVFGPGAGMHIILWVFVISAGTSDMAAIRKSALRCV